MRSGMMGSEEATAWCGDKIALWHLVMEPWRDTWRWDCSVMGDDKIVVWHMEMRLWCDVEMYIILSGPKLQDLWENCGWVLSGRNQLELIPFVEVFPHHIFVHDTPSVAPIIVRCRRDECNKRWGWSLWKWCSCCIMVFLVLYMHFTLWLYLYSDYWSWRSMSCSL